jgi:hypothetical protein
MWRVRYAHQFCCDSHNMIGDNDGQDVRLCSRNGISGDEDYSKYRCFLTWLLVIEEKRNIAEGSDRKKPVAAARKKFPILGG